VVRAAAGGVRKTERELRKEASCQMAGEDLVREGAWRQAWWWWGVCAAGEGARKRQKRRQRAERGNEMLENSFLHTYVWC